MRLACIRSITITMPIDKSRIYYETKEKRRLECELADSICWNHEVTHNDECRCSKSVL